MEPGLVWRRSAILLTDRQQAVIQPPLEGVLSSISTSTRVSMASQTLGAASMMVPISWRSR